MPKVTVVGSVNLDLVATTPSLPRPGETVTDATFERHPGGKGANQALAARRMGADVSLIACVGADAEGETATRLLMEAGVDLSQCRRVVDLPTGVALIVVDAAGENQIVVAPGANRELRPGDVALGAGDVVVCQLEIPVDVVSEALQHAGLGILNCAPARALPPDVLAAADIVVVNETERSFYGDALDTVELVITTLGGNGAVAHRGRTELARMPAIDVTPIDTVGAGDAFVGALAAELASGSDLDHAMRVATAAAGLTTTRRGAQPAIPQRHEVVALLGME
jgi:ribokinase